MSTEDNLLYDLSASTAIHDLEDVDPIGMRSEVELRTDLTLIQYTTLHVHEAVAEIVVVSGQHGESAICRIRMDVDEDTPKVMYGCEATITVLVDGIVIYLSSVRVDEWIVIIAVICYGPAITIFVHG